ncbi:MAG: hypothetical protein R3C45_09535 [Phycisphaerales bacterium]
MPSVVPAAEGLDAQTQQLWERHWRVYAQKCAEFEGGFICCPAYDRRYPSSAGMTVRQAEAELAEKVKVRKANLVYTKTVKMPVGEAEAMANPIPKLAIGEYGFLASVEVVEVLGPTSVMVKDVALIDTAKLNRDYRADRELARQADDSDVADELLEHIYEQRYALVEKQKQKAYQRAVMRIDGYMAQGLTEGERWEGPKGEGIQVMIVSREDYGNERRPKQRLVAVSPEKLKLGLDEAGFIRFLQSRGLEPASFVKRVMDTMAENRPDDAEKMVFASLLTPLAGAGESESADQKTDEAGGGEP